MSSTTLFSTRSILRIGSALILIVTLATGCSTNKSVKASRIAGREAAVVPVTGPPTLVHSENLGIIALSTLAGGLPGAIIAQSVQNDATAGKRATLAGRLNADYADFKPEVILAEECAKVLQTARKVRFSTITLRSEPVPLPGRDEIMGGDTQRFTSLLGRRVDFYKKTMAWTKTVAPREGVGSPSGAQPQISIEVTLAGLDLVNGKKLDVYAVMRVVDLAKGEIIGRQHAGDRYKIRPVTQTSELADFTEDIRRSLNDTAKKGLKELNLL